MINNNYKTTPATWVRTQDGMVINLNHVVAVKPFGKNCATIMAWTNNPHLELNSNYNGTVVFGVYQTEQAAAHVFDRFQKWIFDGKTTLFTFSKV